ncbi:MAG: NAD(+) diphosphatase [Kiritimatiellia bacterium]
MLFHDGKVWASPSADGGARIVFEGGRAVEEVEPGLGVGECADAPAPGARQVDLRSLFDQVPEKDFLLASRGSQLLHWRRTNRFCAVCGAPLARHPNEHAMYCARCGALVYPRVNPVVIVLVHDGPRLLLARKAGGVLPFWSLLAGFVEAGEDLESAVAREIREEVDIAVRDIRYVRSQPWSFPNNLMIAFTAAYAGGVVRPDGVEIAEAGWFSREAPLPPIPGPVSIARRLIDGFFHASGPPPHPPILP